MQSGIPKFELVWRNERKKFCVQWREGGNLKRISAGTDDPQEARRFLADFLSGWLAPPVEKIDNITIKEIIDIYIAYKKKQYRDRYKNDRTLDENFIRRNIRHLDQSIIASLKPIEKIWGDLYPKQINRVHCREFIRRRTEDDGSSIATTKKNLDIFVAAMNHARKEGLLSIVPYIEKPSPPPPRDKWAKPKQVRELLQVLQKYQHLHLFAMLALHTLSRKGAITELQWDQVDLEERRINFNPQGRLQTKKRRVHVPINNSLMAALQKAKESAVTKHVIEFRSRPCYEIGRAFRHYANSIGLGWITPHVLRHTGATLMAQQGISMWEIAGIMGDRVDTVEKHYLKHHPDYLKNAISVLDKIYA